MIISMTGFSSRIVTLTQTPPLGGPPQELFLTVSLKSLNARFFEATCKLPYSLAFLEPELIKYFKKRMMRGTVHFSLYISSPATLSGTIEPSFSTIKGYLASCATIKETFNLPGDVSLPTLLSLPNIFETREAPVDESLIKKIMAVVTDLTDECVRTKLEEGKSLEKDLLERIEHSMKFMQELEPQTKNVIAQKREHLFSTLETLLKETNQETMSDAQTMYIYNQLERMDIHEEIVRFNDHLQKLKAIITSSEQESGKRMDFTLQELVREINTVASKCQDSLISNLVINIKVELEKAREQVQNIV
ncbi:DUF1732 domain-containing protein [Candidatus Dependentiae bacterium]|nr:DUF1732 domain-containing protein [Candidatus Dependentiae bacterium]